MNNTDKAKYDAAKRMLKGKIDITEVAMMMEMTVEELQPIKEEVEKEFHKVYGNMNIYDMESGQVLYDDFNATEENENMDLPEGVNLEDASYDE